MEGDGYDIALYSSNNSHTGLGHKRPASRTSSLLKTFQGSGRRSAANSSNSPTRSGPDSSGHPSAFSQLNGNSPPPSDGSLAVEHGEGSEEGDDEEGGLEHKPPGGSPRPDLATAVPSFAPRISVLLDTPDDTTTPLSSDFSPQLWFSPSGDGGYYSGYGTSPLTTAISPEDSVRDMYLSQKMNYQMNFMQQQQQQMQQYQQMQFLRQQQLMAQSYMMPPNYAMHHAPQPPHMASGMYPPGMYSAPMAWSGPIHPHRVPNMHPPMSINVDTKVSGASPPVGLPMSPIVTDMSIGGAGMAHGPGMHYGGNPYAQMMYEAQPPLQTRVQSQMFHHPAGAPPAGRVVLGDQSGYGSGNGESDKANSEVQAVASVPPRSTRRKRFKSSGDSFFPKGISKAGNSWRIQVQVLCDEMVTVPVGPADSNETKTIPKKKRFNRNISDYNAALWLYEVAILLSDRPFTIEDQVATGNYSILVGQGVS